MDKLGSSACVVAKKPCGSSLPLRIGFAALQQLAKAKLIENKPYSKMVQKNDSPLPHFLRDIHAHP
jgi:hypothetical protein